MLSTTLTACETTQTGVIDTSCTAFVQIKFSSRDTPETVREIREHNAAWAALCDG